MSFAKMCMFQSPKEKEGTNSCYQAAGIKSKYAVKRNSVLLQNCCWKSQQEGKCSKTKVGFTFRNKNGYKYINIEGKCFP